VGEGTVSRFGDMAINMVRDGGLKYGYGYGTWLRIRIWYMSGEGMG
jgi:hypothetical protein